mgnify:FL=1
MSEIKTKTKTKTTTKTTTSSKSSLDAGDAISFEAQGVNSILNAISSYNTAKHNYNLTVQTAADLLEKTEKQVKQVNLEYYQMSEENKAYIAASSGLEGESFSDVERMNLAQKEETVTDLREYARKQAQTMINEARRAKKQAKRAKTGALVGGILGTAAGAVFGGGVGAGIGGGLGAQFGESFGNI